MNKYYFNWGLKALNFHWSFIINTLFRNFWWLIDSQRHLCEGLRKPFILVRRVAELLLCTGAMYAFSFLLFRRHRRHSSLLNSSHKFLLLRQRLFIYFFSHVFPIDITYISIWTVHVRNDSYTIKMLFFEVEKNKKRYCKLVLLINIDIREVLLFNVFQNFLWIKKTKTKKNVCRTFFLLTLLSHCKG